MRSGILLALAIAAAPQLASAQGEKTSEDETTAGLTDKELIADLTRRVEELEKQNEPSIGSASTMKIFGRLHVDGWTFPSPDPAINVFENGDPNMPPEDNIEWRRARLGVSGDVAPNTVYKIELEFGHPERVRLQGPLLRAGTSCRSSSTLLLGNQKRPYGLDHLNSSRYNVFLERPFVDRGLQPGRAATSASRLVRRLGGPRPGTGATGSTACDDWAKDGRGTSRDTLQPELAGRMARTPSWYDEADGGRNYGHCRHLGHVR